MTLPLSPMALLALLAYMDTLAYLAHIASYANYANRAKAIKAAKLPIDHAPKGRGDALSHFFGAVLPKTRRGRVGGQG